MASVRVNNIDHHLRFQAITCRYDIIVEEVISGLENMILLPEETSQLKEYRLPRYKGGLILFLRQYDFDVEDDMVS